MLFWLNIKRLLDWTIRVWQEDLVSFLCLSVKLWIRDQDVANKIGHKNTKFTRNIIHDDNDSLRRIIIITKILYLQKELITRP